jgi:arylsulfatase A-like enzyme
MYESWLRIPLLVRYPRLGVKGKVTNTMAMNIDFAPTIPEVGLAPRLLRGRARLNACEAASGGRDGQSRAKFVPLCQRISLERWG